jgi:hypothetical protein
MSLQRMRPMSRRFLITFAAFISLFLRAGIVPSATNGAEESRNNPLLFLQPTIQFSEDERHRLDGREVLLRILPASGHELAVVAAGALDVGPEALIGSVRDMPGLKRSNYVPQIGRFSPQPRYEDVRELTLDDADLDEIKDCRPDRCGLKLDAGEIARLRQVVDRRRTSSKDANAAAFKGAIEEEFRRILVDRAARYLARGDDDGQDEFLTLLQHSPYAHSRMPKLVSYLERYPAAGLAEGESFLYWSKETYAWKPMITITHVTIMHGNGAAGEPEVIVASRDIFATRYTSGSFVLTLLLRSPESPSQRYLVYINRTWVDAVRSFWRPFVEYRLKGQARKVFAGARERIERFGLASLRPQ